MIILKVTSQRLWENQVLLSFVEFYRLLKGLVTCGRLEVKVEDHSTALDRSVIDN